MRRSRRRKENGKAVCALWTAFLAGCMAVMLSFASRKAIVIADVSREQAGLSVNSEDEAVQETALWLERDRSVTGSLRIPLPRDVRAENIVMENRCMTRELWLYIQSGETRFYGENPVSGDLSHVLSGSSEAKEDGVLLKLGMDHVMEYRSTMEGGELTIVWYEPHALYDYVVVVDPAWGGKEAGIPDPELPGKDVTLQTARQVQKKFSMQNVRLYLTRLEDADVSRADRVALAEEVDADLYLRIGASWADEEGRYGVLGLYNEEYVIPGFGNAELADLTTREVTIASSNRAVGLENAGEESILRELGIPAAEVSLGYLSNPQERYLLGQEDYQEKLADGILNAVAEAVRRLEQ